MSAIFAARFSGKCAGCRAGIRVGQMVTYNADDKIVHAETCSDVEIPTDDPTVLKPTEVLCPDCWTVKPCRCDD